MKKVTLFLALSVLSQSAFAATLKCTVYESTSTHGDAYELKQDLQGNVDAAGDLIQAAVITSPSKCDSTLVIHADAVINPHGSSLDVSIVDTKTGDQAIGQNGQVYFDAPAANFWVTCAIE